MLSIKFLHEIREAELREAMRLIPAGQSILEIGGGTGFQAKLLADMGHAVACIDLHDSVYSDYRVFPVRDFDGVRIPFPERSFDIVFSSNVLEHVTDLDALGAEMRRVLRPGGLCLHLMPSPAWRAWSIVTHYPNLPFLLLAQGRDDNPFPNAGRHSLAYLTGRALWPGRHGESGSMLSELCLFSRSSWLRRFRDLGFSPVAVRPVGLFYTGSMLFGPMLPLSARRRLAPWLGSAATLYLLRPEQPDGQIEPPS